MLRHYSALHLVECLLIVFSFVKLIDLIIFFVRSVLLCWNRDVLTNNYATLARMYDISKSISVLRVFEKLSPRDNCFGKFSADASHELYR